MRRALAGAAAVAYALLPSPLALAGGCEAPHGAVAEIVVGAGCAAPDPVTVRTGAAVVWRNKTATAHEVGGDVAFALPGKASYGTAFARPGTYDYVCRIHPAIRGSVVVTGEATVAATPSRWRSPVPEDAWRWAGAAFVVLLPVGLVLRSVSR